ncbi:MAG: PspA/IM30 family protein [Chloroflexaceae bacterium]|nr:PspA/IM30 family protein [Chloroflexaceae bacterium]
MGLFDRVGRVFRANLNDMVSKAEDPEKILEQAIIDMQEDLVQLRQAVAKAIASQKRTEQEYNNNQAEANKWQQRAQLALTKGDENLAREALVRKKSYAETAAALQGQLTAQSGQTDILKRNLIGLEGKILPKTKTKKNMLKARASAAKANQQLQDTLSNMGTGSALSAFERMEQKVLEMEAVSQAAGELGGTGIEQQFLALESGNVDDELQQLRLQISGAPPAQKLLDSAPTSSTAASDSVIDSELEKLRAELNQ